MKKILLLQFFTIFLYAGNIAVSILPQKYIVSKIADDAKIKVMIPPNASPATYKPSPKELLDLKDAQLYFTIGVPFEKHWLDRFKSVNQKLEFIDSTKGIKKFGNDPHIWLDPTLIDKIAQNITTVLKAKFPQNAKHYETNYKKFSKELKQLDQNIKERTKDIKNREFITYHPSFGYFARRYGFKQVAIEKDGHEPSLRHEIEVVDLAKKLGIDKIFVSPAFSKKEAEFIAKKIDGKVISIDHLSSDLNKTLYKIVRSLE